MGQLFVRRLSRWLTPKFPDRCVVCGADRPGHQARFFADGQYGPFFFHLFLSLDDGKKSITAPACPGCALGSRIGSLWRFAVAATFAALAAWLLFWVVPPARGADDMKALGVVLAAIVPILVWNQYFPPRFILSADNEEGNFHFHFCDAPYAAAFDELNHLPSRQPLPEDLDEEDGPPAESIQHDPANPYQSLTVPRFKN